jgi:hypothetical protein
MRKTSGRRELWPRQSRIKVSANSQSIPPFSCRSCGNFCTPDARVYVNRSKLNTPAKLMGKMRRT